MSVSIIANKKLFHKRLSKCSQPWEMPGYRNSQAVWKVFRLFGEWICSKRGTCFFKKRMPKITKNAKERGKGRLIQSAGVNQDKT